MKLVNIELYVDEVNDKCVGEALGSAIIENRIYYKEAGNFPSKEQEKLTDIIRYCAPHADNMWAATIISKILDCDFRDAKQEAEWLLSALEKVKE